MTVDNRKAADFLLQHHPRSYEYGFIRRHRKNARGHYVFYEHDSIPPGLTNLLPVIRGTIFTV
jgi:hypothetical protein